MTRSLSNSRTEIALVLFLFFAFGCGGGPKSTSEPVQSTSPSTEMQAPAASAGAAGGAQTSDAGAEAKEIFDTRCASCHGDEGRGNGPASTVLNPKPQNFHDSKWQATVSDEQLTQAIIYGGSAVGKSPAMAPNPDLQEKPQVVKDLIAHIRALGKQK